MDLFEWREYDRETRNTDGQRFFGFDNEDGTTNWYDEDGVFDSTTKTPYNMWTEY